LISNRAHIVPYDLSGNSETVADLLYVPYPIDNDININEKENINDKKLILITKGNKQ